MEDNKFKLKLQKIFTSSCKTQNISEVIDHQNPIFNEKNSSSSSPPPISQTLPYPSLTCKPRCPESFDQMILRNCIIPTTGNPIPRRKLAGKYSLLPSSGEFSGRFCPPASPVFPLKQSKKKKQRSQKDIKFSKTHLRNHPFSLSSSNETEFGDWFSSDNERDDHLRETCSKSISFSSDSDHYYQNRARTRVTTRRNKQNRRRVSGSGSSLGSGSGRAGSEEVGTFAVVKSSSDPYNDFRTSMVEMIMEKQIFGAKELESLLKCFLSLNSSHHHHVIVQAFTEICDALFSYAS